MIDVPVPPFQKHPAALRRCVFWLSGSGLQPYGSARLCFVELLLAATFSLTQLFKVFESFRTNSRFYDCDYQYEVLNFQSNYFDFAVIPEPHIKPVYFSNHCEIGRLLCEVTEGFFINLFRKHCFVQPTLSLMESLGRGDQRCVYRVGVSEIIF